MAVKKRTLGDDLRDFKAGKAPDGYRDNMKNTTPFEIKSWQHSDGFVGGEDASYNPLFGDNREKINVNNSENTLWNTVKTTSSDNKKDEEKKKPVIKNANDFAKFGQNAFENPKQGIRTEKNEKKQQYILDLDNSGGLPSSEEISAVGNASLSPFGKITTEADKYREYENEYKDYSYEQFKSEAEKVDDKADNGWKKKWFNSAIVEKRNEFYSDKYKEYDYKKLKTESNNSKLSDEEREWLKNTADEKATSDDLQAEYDSLTKEYNTLYDSRDEESSYNRLKEIEDRQEDLKSLIEKKKYEEKKKAEYDDVIENDVKAKTIMQKYYYLQKYDELNRMFESTGHGIESVKVKSSIDAYNYAKNLTPEERKQIIKDFNSLKNKDTLYKYYKREREEQETAEQNQILTNYSEEHPVLGSLASMGLNTYGSIEDTVKYAGAGIDKAFGGDGYINPDSTNVAKAQVMREKVSEDMDGLGKFFYNTGMSIGDNIARMPLLALPGGKAMSLALAGTSAGVSSANDVINSGGSIESALLTGAAAGTAEVVFEKISLDKLIDLRKQGTDSVFRAVVNQMKTEGLEEVGTDIANAITDQIINGDMSQLALQYQNYIAQGYSEEEARKQIAVDFALQLGQSFAAGAISGGVLSGGTVAINKIGGTIEEKSEKRKSASQLGREALQSEDFNVKELINSAKKSENPKAVNLANSLEKVVEEKGADKVKAVDVGNLLTLTNSKEITYDYSQDLSELTGTDKQNIIGQNFELNGEEKTSKTSDSEVKYTDTKAFGENYPHGLGAKIVKTGERINIVGIKSSSRDFNSDDNTVVLLSDNGELYDSDDIRTSVPYYNDLFDYAKNFDTIGARVYLSQYEDYVKRSKSRGKSADVAEYSESFERLYSYGVKGVTYDSIKKSGNFTREINILGAGVAYSAVQSGNNDFKVDTRDKSNKQQKIRMPGESNSISSKVYVDPGSEESVKVTDEQLAVLQAVADKTGREIVLTDRMGERTGDENANGGYNLSDGKIYINAEVHDSYMLSVSLHEAVHGVAADNPAEYHALCSFITSYLVAKGENIDNLLDDIKVKWGDSVRSEDAVLEELVCQTVMAIATDEAAIKTALSLEENKGILKKVASALKKIAKAAYDFIKGVGIQAHNKQAQPWIDNIEALNELAVRLEKAFESTRKLNEQRASAAENAETEQKNNTHEGVKFSVGYTEDNKPVAIIDDDILAGVPKNQWIKTVKDTLSNKFTGGIPIKGRFIKVNRISKREYTNSKYSQNLKQFNKDIYKDKFKSANNLDEIIIASTNYVNEDLKHTRKDKFKEFARGDVLIRVGNNDYSAKVIIGLTTANNMVLYDIVDFLPTSLKIKKVGTHTAQQQNKNAKSSRTSVSTNTNIQQNNNNVKHSVDDVIDENRDLVAVHNLSAKKLAKMISDFDGQGIPAPSIAIDKADNVHSDFGEISLIFDRNTIDPKADKRNSVYSRDAWTSMYPKTEFKLNEKAMKKLAERLDMSVNELKSNMFDTSDVQKIKYRFEDDFKVRKAFLKENNIKATPVLRDRQPDIMMFSARAVKKFVRKNDCTFDRLVNDKEFRNELFKAYSDGASLKGIANAHIKETDEILDLAKSEEFYSVLKEKFDYAIEYAKGNVQQTEGSMTEAVNNAIEEYKEEFSSYIDELLSSGVLGEEYIVRDDVDPYDENGDRKPFSKTHYKYNIENVVKAMKSGRSKVGSSFTGGISYVKSIGAKKLNSIDEIKGNKNRIVPMTEEEIEAENERISDLIKPLIEEVADSGSYNNDFITASNNIVDAFNSKNNVNGVYSYLKQYHDKIKMSTVKKLFAVKAEIENLPTRYFEAKPHRAVGFDEVKAAVIPADTHEALKRALKELGVPMYEYDSNNENSRAEVTQKAINTEYVDKNGEKRSDLRFSKDDTIDNEYLEAVKNNDLETAQRLVEETAKTWGAYCESGKTPTKLYHGTQSFGFTAFDLTKMDDGISVFLTSSLEIASTYSGVKNAKKISERININVDKLSADRTAELLNKYGNSAKYNYKYYSKSEVEKLKSDNNSKYGQRLKRDKISGDIIVAQNKINPLFYTYSIKTAKELLKQYVGGGNYSLYAKLDNPYVVECDGAYYNDITYYEVLTEELKEYYPNGLWRKGNTRDIAEYAKQQGFDGVIFKKLKDNGGKNSNVPHDTVADVYIVFNPNNIKSADPVTYDDNWHVIPLSERFNNEKSDIRYSKDDTIVDYSDLTALDDEEIKVYNKRGWANQLFTNEDRKLLEGEFAKLKPVKTQRTDNVLGDGSRIVEVNNKIVLIGGTFAEPEIYCVFAINAANETEADIYKEWFYRDSNEFKQSKEEFANNCKCYESSLGETFVRAYIAVDFSYYKGHKDYGERAVLPSSFKNYGYTQQFQDGTGNNRKAGRNVSEIKLAVDDTINDGMFADGDLFDEDGYIQQSVFERAVKDNPDFALTAVYNHAAKTAETAIKQSSDVKLDDKAYLLAAHRLMTRYDISRKLNKGFDEELAQTIRKHIERMEKGVTDFAGELELLVDDCKDALMLSGKLDGEALKTEREEILGYLRGKTLILTEYAESDVRGDYDTLQNYRKRMFGKVNVGYEKNLKNNSKGLFWDSGNNIYINDVIAFVEERFPHLITDDADDISGYRWLDNLVNNVLKPKFVNSYIDGFYENIDTAAIEMAFDVTTEIINAKAKYAVADSKTERKYIRKIAIAKEQAAAEQRALLKAKVESYSDKAKEERSKRIKMIENLRRRMSEITDKSDKQRLKYEAQIDKLKTSLDEKTIILNMGYETIREQYNENRTKTVYREKLGRMLDRMTKKLDGKANNNEYIPEVLKKPILDVLSSFTVDPGTYKNGKKKALPGYYGEWKNIAKIGDRVNELTNAYESLKSKNDSKEKKYSFIDVNSIAFREGTLEVLKYLSEKLNGKNIYDLSADDLIDIYEAMQELDNSLRSAVEIILDGQKMSVQEAANRAIAETESVKYKKDVQRFSNTAVNFAAGIPREIKNKFFATQLDPVRYGRKLSGYHDDYVISQVMRELHEGDKKHTRIMQECFVRVQAVTSKYSKSEIKGLQRDDVTEFNFKEQKTGKRVKVSQGMLLAIYLTDRQADGHRHLANENFNHYTVIPDLDMMNLGRDGMNKSHRVRFSESDLRAIKQYVENNKMLSELAGAISEVYNTILNQYINEVSMAKYGKLIATVKNYYPLWVYSDGAHYEKNFEAEFNDIRMKSRSFTKQRTRSYDPIVINDVLKTFTKSVQSASEYCGLLIPIENFKRIYNSGNGDVTLHEAIKEKFGESAEHYIEKLMADLQNAPEILDNTWLQKAQGNFMGAKLLLNPGAAIKQLAAFPTAYNYFGVKNVTAAAAVGMAKIDFDLYAKYTPYLWYRKNGNGTVIGELSREIGFYKKSMDRLDIMGKMDRYVVGCLLYAAELHVEQTTDLNRGTDAFYKEVVRQFEKCVDETQPNNMITSKPQFIRNNVMKLLSLNAFKSQNMAIVNCVIDSFGEYNARRAEYKESKTEEAKAAKNEAAKKFAGSVIGAVCSSALIGILTVAVNLFIWHKWDDFKDEEGNVTPLTILQNFIDYSLESLAGCFAWGDKAYEAICAGLDLGKFFGFEVMSVDTLNDAIDNLTKGKLLDFAANIADMFGLPMENGLRILRSISSYANDIWNGNGEIITENNSLLWENNTSYFNFIIVEAKQKGEAEKAEHFEQLWKDDLISKGKTEEQANDTIKTKLVTALAVSDDDVEQAALAKANGDLSSYEEHMNKVVGYGFDSVDVKKAVDKVIKNVADDVKNRGLEEKSDIIADLKNQGFNDKGAEYVYNSMQSGESPESEDELSAFSDTSEGGGVAYTYSDAFEYLKNGDRENYERIEQYLIDNADKTKKDVQSAMRSASRTDELWKEYFEAQGTLSGGGDPVKLEELKKTLINIYGSWSTAAAYGRKYKERMKKKEREKNK